MEGVLNRNIRPRSIITENQTYVLLALNKASESRSCGRYGISHRPCGARPTHVVACAGLVAHPNVMAVEVEIPLAAAEALISELCRHVESPINVAVLVAQLFYQQ